MMEDFLRQTSQKLQSNSFQDVHVVMGNTTCDLDSGVSTVAFAFYLNQTKAQSSSSTLFLPVLNIPRNKYHLRTELVYCFKEFNITQDLLTFKDDLDLDALRSEGSLSLTLVDHHTLDQDGKILQDCVSCVIDHRPGLWRGREDVSVTIEIVGSCCTLIADVLMSCEKFVMPRELAIMLYATILVDTINLSPEAGKTTGKDTDTLQKLLPFTDGFDVEKFYERIMKAKFDMTGLSTPEALEKDLKVVTGSACCVAMASVTMDMELLCRRANFEDDLQRFMEEMQADAVVIMTLCVHDNGPPTRQLAVFSKDVNMKTHICQSLHSCHEPNLQLCEYLQNLSNPRITYFTQGNVPASRKQVLPLITELCNKNSNRVNRDVSKGEATSQNFNNNGNLNSQYDLPRLVMPDSIDNDEIGDLTEADLIESPRSLNILFPAAYGSNPSSNPTSCPGSGFPSVPVTPPNSFREGGEWPIGRTEANLPSFNSSEMVRKIEEKKAMLGLATGQWSGQGSLLGSQVNSEPFTPQNSLVESMLESYVMEVGLPSMNSSDFVKRINQKRSSMGGEIHSPGDVAMGATGSVPFTPQNSYMESSLLGDWLNTDAVDPQVLRNHLLYVQQLAQADRPRGLSSSSFSGDSFSMPSSMTSSSSSKRETENIVAMEIARCMLLDEEDGEENQNEGHCDGGGSDGGGAGGTKRRGRSGSSPENCKGDDGRGAGGDQNQGRHRTSKSGPMEHEVVEEVVQDLLDAIVTQALDSFPDMRIPTVAEKVTQVVFGQRHNPDVTRGLEKNPSTGSLTVETDYLPRMDPLHGNMDLNTEQEIIESTSFRKVSFEGFNFSPLGSPKVLGSPVIEHRNLPVLYTFAERLVQEVLTAAISVLTTENGTNGLIGLKVSIGAKQKPGQLDLDLSPGKQQSLQSSSSTPSSSSSSCTDSSSSVVSISSTEGSYKVFSPVEPSALPLGDKNLTIVIDDNPGFSTSSISNESLSSGKFGYQELSPLVQQEVNLISDEDLSSDVDAIHDLSPIKKNMTSTQCASKDKNIGLHPEGSVISDESLSSDGCVEDDLPTLHHGKNETKQAQAEGGSGFLETQNSDLCPSDVIISDESLTSSMGADEDVLPIVQAEILPSDVESPLHLHRISSSSKESLSTEQSDLALHQQHEGVSVPTSPLSDTTEGRNIDDPSPTHTGCNFAASSSFSSSPYDSNSTELSSGPVTCSSDTSPLHVPNPPTSSWKDKVKEALPQQLESILLGMRGGKKGKPKEESSVNNKVQKKVLKRNKRCSKTNQIKQVQSVPPMSNKENKKDNLHGVDFSEEWQYDDIPGLEKHEESEEEGSATDDSSSGHESDASDDHTPSRPSLLATHQPQQGSTGRNILTEGNGPTDDTGEVIGELEWENDTPIKSPVETIPQYSAKEEMHDAKHWRTVEILGQQHRMDLKVIEPFKKVLTHGGYYGDGLNAIIVFSGCYLPSHSRTDYQYVMDNLFLYIISTLELLVAEDYMIVYFQGATPRQQMPSFGWLKKCYQMIDRRLRKNLKGLLLVHPTLWLRTLIIMTKPFISSKFSSKLRYIRSLEELEQVLPMEYIYVPEQVKRFDAQTSKHTPQSASPSQASPSTSSPDI